MSVSMGYGGYMGDSSGMGGTGSGLLSFMDSWPTWATTMATLLAILIGGWIVGKIIGAIYSNIKYPDPEKPQIFTKKQKIVFLAAMVAVVGMVYYGLQPEPMDEGMGEEMYAGMGMDSNVYIG